MSVESKAADPLVEAAAAAVKLHDEERFAAKEALKRKLRKELEEIRPLLAAVGVEGVTLEKRHFCVHASEGLYLSWSGDFFISGGSGPRVAGNLYLDQAVEEHFATLSETDIVRLVREGVAKMIEILQHRTETFKRTRAVLETSVKA